jgi:DNA anti-recombination protein RmuC
MSEFEKLKGGVESEISAWKSLVSGDSPLALLERVDTLKTQVDEALIYLNETQDALLAFPDLISNALELTKREVEEASASFLTTARELATALSEQATEVMERTAQSAIDEFAEIQDFVTDGFLEKVKDCYETKVATVCEAGAELRDEVEEQLDEFVETTKEQVAGLTERLDEFGEE